MSKKKKIIIAIIAIILVLVIVVLTIASNYLVYYAIERKENPMENIEEIVPESALASEDAQIIAENYRRMWEEALVWAESAENRQLSIESDDGLKLVAYFYPNPDSHDYAITLHGYTSNHWGMTDIAAQYAEWGYNVLMPDLRSHGESEGKYIGMGWPDRRDIVKWIDEILKMDDKANIIIHGVSMGAATSMMVSGEELPFNVKCIIEDCGYTSVWDIFRDELAYIFKLPAFPLLYTASLTAKIKAGYFFKEASALDQIKKSTLPMLFIHGDTDTFINPEMVYTLYNAYQGEKDILVVEGAGHGEAVHRQPEIYFEKVKSFIENH